MHQVCGSTRIPAVSDAEAAARLAHVGPNRLDPAAQVPPWRKFLAHFADPLIYLLLGAVVVSVGAWVLEGTSGMPTEAIVIAAIVVANAVLGFVQERSAERAVAALQRMVAPTARVLRIRTEHSVAAMDVVPGDILLLA